MTDFMKSMLDQEKPKSSTSAADIERQIEAIKEERKRRLNPPVSARSGKPVHDKAALADLNRREAALRTQLAKARADEARARAKP